MTGRGNGLIPADLTNEELFNSFDDEDSNDAFASRDEDSEPNEPEQPPISWDTRHELVRKIRAHASEIWISLRLGLRELVSVAPGAVVTVSAPTGAGKSSIAACIASQHAREEGISLILSRELTSHVFAARLIGIATDTSWRDVVQGQLTDDEMLAALPERLRMASRHDATLDALDAELARIRAAEPEVPILAVIDYGQIIGEASDDQRARVSAAWEHSHDIAESHRAVLLILSQMSRASSRAARGGERLGADAIDGGAESAAIERYSTVTLEIGAQGPEDQHGRREVQVSIGKGRMGGGDTVLPCVYEGRTGRWAVVGEARSAADVRAEAAAKKDERRATNAELAVAAAAGKAARPMTRGDLAEAARVRRKDGTEAARRLLERGELVEVRQRKGRSGHWMVWTRERAEAAGIEIVEDEKTGGASHAE